MTEELKPCPFCREPAEYTWKPMGICSLPAVCCPNPLCDSTLIVTGQTKHQAAQNWNTRPIEDALRAEVEELRVELDRMKDANRWISVEERLPDKWYSDLGDELIVFKPGFTDMEFPAKWDNDAQEFFTGGYGKPVTRWKGITHYHQMPAPPEANDE